VLQTGAAAVVHCELSTHWTHVSYAVPSVGVRSHTVPPVQFPFEVHWTHALVFVSQTGVAPVHAAKSPLPHWTHRLFTHAGLVVVGHSPAMRGGTNVEAGLFPEHGPHVVPTQTGEAPWH
jgi:hypothetical protein